MTTYFHYRLPDGSETAGWIDQGEGLAMTKLEQVARAIQQSDFEDAGIPWENINPEGQSDYLKYARAAVKSLMGDPNINIAYWDSTLDEILNEKSDDEA